MAVSVVDQLPAVGLEVDVPHLGTLPGDERPNREEDVPESSIKE